MLTSSQSVSTSWRSLSSSFSFDVIPYFIHSFRSIYYQIDPACNRAAPIPTIMAQVQQDLELDRPSSHSRDIADSHATEQQDIVEEIEQVSLPPTDRGKEAWLVLAGCSLIQVPVWGMSAAMPRGHQVTTHRVLSRFRRFPRILWQSFRQAGRRFEQRRSNWNHHDSTLLKRHAKARKY